MNDIKFRIAEMTDIPVLLKMREAQLTEEGARGEVDISFALSDFFIRGFSDGRCVCWLAKLDKEVIATSGITFLSVPTYYSNPQGIIGWVSGVFTKLKYRRMGLAKTLLDNITQEARARSCGIVRLSSSKAGIPLYLSYGFYKRDCLLEYKLDMQ